MLNNFDTAEVERGFCEVQLTRFRTQARIDLLWLQKCTVHIYNTRICIVEYIRL